MRQPAAGWIGPTPGRPAGPFRTTLSFTARSFPLLTDSRSEAHTGRLTLALLVAGLGLSLLMWVRSQVAGDQLNLLARGWILAIDGEWIPYGTPTSAGGVVPGGLISALIGLPLLVWKDHRAPTLVLVALHVVGFLLLDRVVARILGARGRLLFAVLYWLNPWRLYHSAFLWNPNYLIPAGAIHLWTIYQLRHRARALPSLLHVLVIGLALQVHVSAMLLLIVSALLLLRGYFRLHWPTASLAALTLAASLIPWALALLADPTLLPQAPDVLARGLLPLLAAIRGAAFWVRYASLSTSSSISCLDFSALMGTASTSLSTPTPGVVKAVLGLLTLPAAVWANYRLWRHPGRWWRAWSVTAPDRDWLEGVVRWSFLGAILGCCLSPTTPMSWQLIGVLHLAVLPLVLAATALLEGRWSGATTRATRGYALLSIATATAIALGSPSYRCGGERCGSRNVIMPALRSDHPMLTELGITSTCPVDVNQPDGWWPDVLPETPAEFQPGTAER